MGGNFDPNAVDPYGMPPPNILPVLGAGRNNPTPVDDPSLTVGSTQPAMNPSAFMPAPTSPIFPISVGSNTSGSSATEGKKLPEGWLDENIKYTKQTEQAMRQKAAIEANAANETYAAHRKSMDEQRADLAKLDVEAAKTKAHVAEKEAEYEKWYAEYQTKKPKYRGALEINPIAAVANAIAAALQGYQYGLMGSTAKPSALQALDDMITRDYAAQENEIEKSKEKGAMLRGDLGYWRSKVGDINTAREYAYASKAREYADIAKGIALKSQSPMIKTMAEITANDLAQKSQEKLLGIIWQTQPTVQKHSSTSSQKLAYPMVDPQTGMVHPVDTATAQGLMVGQGWKPASQQQPLQPLPDKRQEKMEGIQDTIRAIQAVKDSFLRAKQNSLQGKVDPRLRAEFEASFGKFADLYRKNITGAAASEGELKRIESRMRTGSLMDLFAPEVFFKKLNNFHYESIQNLRDRPDMFRHLQPDVQQQVLNYGGIDKQTVEDIRALRQSKSKH